MDDDSSHKSQQTHLTNISCLYRSTASILVSGILTLDLLGIRLIPEFVVLHSTKQSTCFIHGNTLMLEPWPYFEWMCLDCVLYVWSLWEDLGSSFWMALTWQLLVGSPLTTGCFKNPYTSRAVLQILFCLLLHFFLLILQFWRLCHQRSCLIHTSPKQPAVVSDRDFVRALSEKGKNMDRHC